MVIGIILSIIGILLSVIGILVSVICWRFAYSDVRKYNKMRKELDELEFSDLNDIVICDIYQRVEAMHKCKNSISISEIEDVSRENLSKEWIDKHDVVLSFANMFEKQLKYFDRHPEDKKKYDELMRKNINQNKKST